MLERHDVIDADSAGMSHIRTHELDKAAIRLVP